MEKRYLYVEGGAFKQSAQEGELGYLGITDGSEVFREAFYHLFEKVTPTVRLQIVVQPTGSVNSARNLFLQKSSNSLLLIDLDKPESARASRISELQLIDYAESIFFMIQEMEGWFLSQPDAIEKVFSSELIKGKAGYLAKDIQEKAPDVTAIAKPYKLLDSLIQDYFKIEKNGKIKKKHYHKVKDAPRILEALDVTRLCADFPDFNRLAETLRGLA